MMRNFFVLALIVGVSFAAKLKTDKKKTTTNVKSFSHHGDYHDDPHQGGGILPTQVLVSTAQDGNCRHWCLNPEGTAYCCESTSQAESPLVEKVNLYCPKIRDHCPFVPIRGGPKTCSNDGSCSSNSKCCYDKCLDKSVCKFGSQTDPNIGFPFHQPGGFHQQPSNPGFQVGIQQHPFNPGFQGGLQQQPFNPGFQGGFQQQLFNPGFQGGFQQQPFNPGFQGGFQQQPFNPGFQGGFQQQYPGFSGGFQQQQPFRNPGFQQQFIPGFTNQYQQPQQSHHGYPNVGKYVGQIGK